VEDDTQLEVDNHSIITPPKQFFDNETEFNEVHVTSKKEQKMGH
jgi:hypothetical protein